MSESTRELLESTLRVLSKKEGLLVETEKSLVVIIKSFVKDNIYIFSKIRQSVTNSACVCGVLKRVIISTLDDGELNWGRVIAILGLIYHFRYEMTPYQLYKLADFFVQRCGAFIQKNGGYTHCVQKFKSTGLPTSYVFVYVILLLFGFMFIRVINK